MGGGEKIDSFDVADVPIPFAIYDPDCGELEDPNELWIAERCSDDMPLLQAMIDEQVQDNELEPMVINSETGIRTYELATNANSHVAVDWYLLCMTSSTPYRTGDAEKKKALCLAKALNRGQQAYDHARVVFRNACKPDRFGPIANWPNALWRALYIMFDSRTPCAIEWGPELRLLYNSGYAVIAGHRHPRALGRRMSDPDCWADIWDDIRPQWESAFGGTAVNIGPVRFDLWDAEAEMMMERYFEYHLAPFDDDDGVPLGVLNTVTECTEQIYSDRCYGVTMPAISKGGGYMPREEDLFDTLRQGLGSNPLDLPAVLVYDIRESLAKLVVTIGAANADIPDLVKEHKMGDASDLAICKLLDDTISTRRTVESADEQLLGAFGTPDSKPVRGFMYPIISDSSGELIAAVFIGLNPHRKLEGSYQTFLELLVAHIGSSLRNMIHTKAQLKHHEDIAKLNAARNAELQAALEQRTKDLTDVEARYANMSDHSPAGIFLINPEGAVIYVNQAAWDIAGAKTPEFERIESLVQDVRTWVHPDFIDEYVGQLQHMFTTLTPIQHTYRAAKDWPDGNPRWLKIIMRIEKNEDGTARFFHGFCVDVSHIKQLEDMTNKRINDALESKRQQEAFIDMTSHEMRNPLSAIAQTAELVTAGLGKALRLKDVGTMQQAISEAYDMVVNIDLLSRHMRCIADDMIAISKINSDLLAVRPTTIVVADFAKQVLGMFAAEAKAQLIDIQLKLDQAAVDAETRCQFDPARVSQILINLITNAIKHISRKPSKDVDKIVEVSVSLAADPPFAMDVHGAVKTPLKEADAFTPSGSPKPVEVSAEQYLVFSVQDNGQGLSQEDADQIFKRFTEQGPKTHNKYGGSGLSLFICRRLAELQGGQIASQPVPAGTTGTRFAFYVRAPPSDASVAATTTPMDQLGDDYFAHFTRPTALGQSPIDVLIPPEEPAQVPQQAYSMNAIPRSTPSAQPMTPVPEAPQPIRALIVEDNFLNQRLLQKQLQKAGYDVEVANNGLECLNKVREEPFFDVILLDREMPVCDGLACLLQLREMEKQGKLAPKERKSSTMSTASSHADVMSVNGGTPSEMDNSMHAPLAPRHSSLSAISPTKMLDVLESERATPGSKRRRSDQPELLTNKKQNIGEEGDNGALRSSKLAVITISANARREQIEEMMNAGSDDYVTKPFRFPDLDARIKKLLHTLSDC